MTTPTNTNCLEGMRCPNPDCRSLQPFRIEATTLAEMTDEGSVEECGMEWTDESYCYCIMCSFEGKVRDFKIQGDKK